MHVPSGFCSISVCIAAAGLSAGAVLASRWLDRGTSPRLAPPALAVLTAAVFAAQMLNVPVAGGTSGHLVGGALLGILAGPFSGLVAMIAILATQALLFADGGIAALGVNVLTMGVVGVLGGWALHRAGAGSSRRRGVVAAGLAAAVSTVAAAALCAVALGLSGTVPLGTALAAMTLTHLPIALIEGAATAAVVAAIANPAALGLRWPAAVAVVACALAPCASSLPDGLDYTAAQLGFADRATAWAAPLADYAVPGLPGGLAIVLAGLIGALVVGLVVRSLAYTSLSVPVKAA